MRGRRGGFGIGGRRRPPIFRGRRPFFRPLWGVGCLLWPMIGLGSFLLLALLLGGFR
ncbi:MAG: hypothetical protein GXP39_11550 [Chloroflexi bacterium]|nr:hypothetical protein [Chloroflexota bacterium]